MIVPKIPSHKFYNLGWGLHDYRKHVFSLFHPTVDRDREIKVIIVCPRFFIPRYIDNYQILLENFLVKWIIFMAWKIPKQTNSKLVAYFPQLCSSRFGLSSDI